MIMSQHTTEPWHYHDNETYFEVLGESQSIGDTCASSCLGDKALGEANARRIVACVNLCAGMDIDDIEGTLALESNVLFYSRRKEAEIKTIKTQRDELLAALKLYHQAFDQIFAQRLSNPIKDAWGRNVDCTLLNEAYEAGRSAIAKCEVQS